MAACRSPAKECRRVHQTRRPPQQDCGQTVGLLRRSDSHSRGRAGWAVGKKAGPGRFGPGPTRRRGVSRESVPPQQGFGREQCAAAAGVSAHHGQMTRRTNRGRRFGRGERARADGGDGGVRSAEAFSFSAFQFHVRSIVVSVRGPVAGPLGKAEGTIETRRTCLNCAFDLQARCPARESCLQPRCRPFRSCSVQSCCSINFREVHRNPREKD